MWSLPRKSSLANVVYFSFPSLSPARLLRWDRSGCIVSESFDITEQFDLLCDLLWQFSQASPAERGHDVTVEPALPEDESLFHSLITEAVVRSVPFDKYTLSGVALGGGAKMTNAFCSEFTSGIAFGSRAFRKWLDLSLDIHSSPAAEEERLRNDLKPDSCAERWSEFLQEHNMESG
ncbi:hypothetical protein C8Q74DRAFT_1371623 [Fomes fomentarius]|nr:hypothetical protein C8Q74DRAFT_1371623 [Fomes fomentarius]